jgi:hypothetical protein
LTPAKVASLEFVLLHSLTLDDQVDAQPPIVPDVCTFVVDHDLVRSWSKLHRHPHHRKSASSGVGKVKRGNSWLRCTISSIALSEADPEKQLCYMSSIGKSEYDHRARKRDHASHAGAGHADHPSAAENKYRS